MNDLSRLSLNQISLQRLSLREAVEACARRGVAYIGVWRDKLAETSVPAATKHLRESGVGVSSLCRGGFFSAPTAAAREAALEDNRRAIEACAAIDSPVLVLVCGPARGQTLADARLTVRDGIAALLPYAHEHGVRLGIEPLHPMYAAERSVVVTLAQANDMVEELHHPNAGVIADVFHIWWDPAVLPEMARAAGRLLGFHVSDWPVPLPDMLLGRGLMGEGTIELPSLRLSADAAGYRGPIEVEIFNQQLWDRDPDDAFDAICRAYLDHV